MSTEELTKFLGFGWILMIGLDIFFTKFIIRAELWIEDKLQEIYKNNKKS
jgi:hypothetical protein